MSSKNSNKLNIPEAKAAMNKFKMEAASEVGVNLKRLQRRSDLPRGRLCRRPDGQKDDRELREEPVKKASFAKRRQRARPTGRALFCSVL